MAIDSIPTTGDLTASASDLPMPTDSVQMIGPAEAQIELSMTVPGGVSPAEAMGSEAAPIPMEAIDVTAPAYPWLGIALFGLVLLMGLRGR